MYKKLLPDFFETLYFNRTTSIIGPLQLQSNLYNWAPLN